ncbi:TPA: aldolase/citrate lyase family protein [Bacillus cereus]
MLKLMFITNNPLVAIEAETAGVNRIFVDLEEHGKKERQGHLDTHITTHKIEDVRKISKVLSNAELLVRINPIHKESGHEIDSVIEMGADVIMLPMFKSKGEVEKFVSLVNGRVKVCLLLETPQAFVRVRDIIEVKGIDEIHIGLNDLHLGMGLDFMFELISGGIVDYLSNLLDQKGIDFGFGGIARIGEGFIPAELVIKEHVRLNSQMVILSRKFLPDRDQTTSINDINLIQEIKKIREVETAAHNRGNEEIEFDRKLFNTKVSAFVGN